MSDNGEKICGKYKILNFPSTATLLGVGVVSLAVIIVLMLFTKEIPTQNVSPLNLVTGIVLGWGSSVVSFYFGDSKKSSQQQDTITSLTAAPKEAAVLQKEAAETQVKAADKQLDAAGKD